jgi:hypothetical protein
VQCGDVITTATRLSRNLNNCPADGVIVGAPRVTLDLDGHTIDGVGAGIGVNNNGGYDRVTVKDGRVHQFMDGIRLQNADENRLSRLRGSVNAGRGWRSRCPTTTGSTGSPRRTTPATGSS